MAGEPARKYIDLLNCAKVHFGYVAVVGYAWVVMFEYSARRALPFAYPGELGVVVVHYG